MRVATHGGVPHAQRAVLARRHRCVPGAPQTTFTPNSCGTCAWPTVVVSHTRSVPSSLAVTAVCLAHHRQPWCRTQVHTRAWPLMVVSHTRSVPSSLAVTAVCLAHHRQPWFQTQVDTCAWPTVVVSHTRSVPSSLAVTAVCLTPRRNPCWLEYQGSKTLYLSRV